VLDGARNRLRSSHIHTLTVTVASSNVLSTSMDLAKQHATYSGTELSCPLDSTAAHTSIPNVHRGHLSRRDSKLRGVELDGHAPRVLAGTSARVLRPWRSGIRAHDARRGRRAVANLHERAQAARTVVRRGCARDPREIACDEACRVQQRVRPAASPVSARGEVSTREYAHGPGTTTISFCAMSLRATNHFSFIPPRRAPSPIVYVHSPLCVPTVSPFHDTMLPGRGGTYCVTNSEKRRFSPTKQMPIDSARSAVGRFARRASSRTYGFWRSPKGKSVRARLVRGIDER
jgi:hypothetical protein